MVEVFVRKNHTKAVLEIPGLLVSRVELPITPQVQEEFEKTAWENAQRIQNYLESKKPKVNLDLKRRISEIACSNGNLVDVFVYVPTDSLKNFDTGVDLI